MVKLSSLSNTVIDSLPRMSAYSVTCFAMINEDLVHNILSRLPAKSFASAACVSKYWNIICSRILSRPKLSTAISLNRSLSVAVEEVVDKVLSEPIRPHFAIVNIAGQSDMKRTMRLITEHFGCKLPIIVSTVQGILGRDALSSEFKEVMFMNDSDLISSEGILLTIGFLPGLKVEAITLQKSQASREQMIDKFAMDIREYSAPVSGLGSPIGIIMFCKEHSDMGPVLDKLDHTMPVDTVIVGDEKGSFVCQCANGPREPFCKTDNSEAVALVFARTGENSLVISSTSSRVHPVYFCLLKGKFNSRLSFQVEFHLLVPDTTHKAVSVKNKCSSTWLTARREGQPEILDGESILDYIDNELDNHVLNPALYIGVTKRRKISVALQKPKITTSMAYHAVVDGDEEYLFVIGNDIRTGDSFQFYHSDPIAAQSSCSEVSCKFNNFNKVKNSAKDQDHSDDAVANVFGGLIFSCCGRGDPFFGRANVDSSPFLENFPGVPLAGVFCGGEIGRFSSASIRSCLHVYSSVYLVMSYTPPLTC